jgi:hypothetical protein
MVGYRLPIPTSIPTAISTTTGIDIDTDVDTDIYQVVGGADKRFGSFYVGASAGYARGETHVSTRESFDGFLFDDEFDVGTHNPRFLRMLRTTSMRTSS